MMGNRMRIITALMLSLSLLMATSQQLAAQQITRPLEHCLDQLPLGAPQGDPTLRLICRRAYLTALSVDDRIPAWVAYTVDHHSAVGCEPRNSRFSPDLSVPAEQRAEPRDYARSGYDMGHMAPAAAMAWAPDVQDESFIMTNVAPQTPNLNRGAWRLLETMVRAWSLEGRRLIIYTGGIWSRSSARIGRGVTVPDQFFKVVVDVDSGEHLGFVMPNSGRVTTDLRHHQVSVAEIQRRSGLELPVQGDRRQITEIWPADVRRLAAEKREECG
jgi:endonuclease G